MDPNVEAQNEIIESLREEENYLMQKYNEKRDQEKIQQMQEEANKKLEMRRIEKPTRAGGIYIPPHKLREIENDLKNS